MKTIFTVITAFPEIFPGSLGCSLAGKAKSNLWDINIVDLKEFGLGKHKNIDSKPYGGGNSLIIRADVLGDAIEYALKKYQQSGEYIIISPSPRGDLFNSSTVGNLLEYKHIIFICGRYGGIDTRVIEYFNVLELSIGNYVLSGGELASLVIMDSCIRFIPGVLKNAETLKEDSFSLSYKGKPLLQSSQYTRPSIWRNLEVPEILSSGNHQKVHQWKLDESIEITEKKFSAKK